MEIAIAEYIQAIPNSAESQNAADAVIAVIAQTQDILTIVQSSSVLLTSPDAHQRSHGAQLLAKIVSSCDARLMTSQSATVLLEFFLSRLDDSPSVPHHLNGIKSLLEKKVLDTADTGAIPQRIFNELNVQTYPQPVRYTAFQIFALLFEQNIDGLKLQSLDFVFGFVHALDGEKDPRNLLLAFQLVKLIVLQLDFNKYKQDLFEVVFCYFPITFKAQPDDPLGLTTNDLKDKLRDAISSTSKFAPFAVPVIIEKMSSDSWSAKVYPK